MRGSARHEPDGYILDVIAFSEVKFQGGSIVRHHNGPVEPAVLDNLAVQILQLAGFYDTQMPYIGLFTVPESRCSLDGGIFQLAPDQTVSRSVFAPAEVFEGFCFGNNKWNCNF